MKQKYLALFVFVISSHAAFANHGVGALGALVPIFFAIAFIFVFNFFLCMYNVNRKSKLLRIWSILLLLPALLLPIALFYASFTAGFIACFFILLKGIFIYLSFPKSES